MYPPPVHTLVVSNKGMQTGRLQPPALLSTVFSTYSRLVRGNNSSHYVPRQLDYPTNHMSYIDYLLFDAHI